MMSAQTLTTDGAGTERVLRSRRKPLRIMALGAAASIIMSITGLAVAAPSQASSLHYYIYGYTTLDHCSRDRTYEIGILSGRYGGTWNGRCEKAVTKYQTTWNLDLWES